MSVSMKTGGIAAAWMDGKIVDASSASVSLLTHALHYATAVFEGIRAYAVGNRVAIFRLMDHMQRLVVSAKAMGIPMVFTAEQLAEAVCDLIRKGKLKQDLYIRPIAFMGEGLTLRPKEPQGHVAILVVPWTTQPSKGLRLYISRFRRPHPASTVITAKSAAHYQNSLLAAQEAASKGFDDALQLDHEGSVAETTVANVFMVKRGTVATPAPGAILAGFTRNTVKAIISVQDKRRWSERTTSLEGLLAADEVFVAGTAQEIVPVTAVNGKTFQVGPVTEQIRDTYQKVVRGQALQEKNWITWV